MPPFRILDAMFYSLGFYSFRGRDMVAGISEKDILLEEPHIDMLPTPPKVPSKRNTTDNWTERQLQNKKYWGYIRNHLDWLDDNITYPEPNKSNFQDLRIKGTGCALRARQTIKQKEISAAFVMRGRKSIGYFYSLRIEQEEIEAEFGNKLEWMPEETSYKQIGCRNTEIDPADETDWHNQHTWLSDTLKKLYKVFGPRVERLTKEF